MAIATLAFGLAACDSAQAPDAPTPAVSEGLFDASVFDATNQVIAVRNAPDTESRDRVFRVDPGLVQKNRIYDEPKFEQQLGEEIQSLQQAAFARDGRQFYATYDAADGSGKIVRTSRAGTIIAVTDAGENPKGVFVDIDVSTGFVGIADFGTSPTDSQILIYNDNFLDGEAPVIVVDNLGTGGRAWDLFYANDEQILFVAKTNGEVVAYDNFVSQAQAFIGAGVPIVPTREIAVSNPNTPATKESTNFHGLAFDSDTGILVVSDVRNPANILSGRLYTVDNADTADGIVPFRARIQSNAGGDQNRLGNPVDVLGFGSSVYVAAKGENAVLRFDNILTITGAQGIPYPPDASIPVEGAESVSFFNR